MTTALTILSTCNVRKGKGREREGGERESGCGGWEVRAISLAALASHPHAEPPSPATFAVHPSAVTLVGRLEKQRRIEYMQRGEETSKRRQAVGSTRGMQQRASHTGSRAEERWAREIGRCRASDEIRRQTLQAAKRERDVSDRRARSERRRYDGPISDLPGCARPSRFLPQRQTS